MAGLSFFVDLIENWAWIGWLVSIALREGQSDELWNIPSELTEALTGMGGAFAPQPGHGPRITLPRA